jgi:hypothetical protein
MSRRLRVSLTSSRAIVAEARGEPERAAELFRRAAEDWAEHGFGLEEARSRLGLARCVAATGRADLGRAELERARELLEPLGARPMLQEVDSLLAAAAR